MHQSSELVIDFSGMMSPLSCHPLTREKKEEAKHEAANIKDQAAQEKMVYKEQAHERRLEATGTYALGTSWQGSATIM